METSNNNRKAFIMRMSYTGIFSELPPEKAGVLIQAICKYACDGEIPSLQQPDVAMAFKFIKHDLDYDSKKYAEICAKRAQNGKKGGLAKASKCYQMPDLLSKTSKSWHKDKDKDKDNTKDKDNITTTTITSTPKVASVSKPRKKSRLQVFSNCVIASFEPDVVTDAQKGVWFKRNARCLADILSFCENNIEVAIWTISECCDWLSQNKLDGGYEAVVRNITKFYPIAKKKVGQGYRWNFSKELQEQIKSLEDK